MRFCERRVMHESMQMEDAKQIIGESILDVMIRRCRQHYGMDVGLKKRFHAQLATNIRLFAEEYFKQPNADTTDLFFFWALRQVFTVLDEEEIAMASTTPVGDGQHVERESLWLRHGLVDVIEYYSGNYRGRVCWVS